MTTISAQVIKASKHAHSGKTLWTVLCRYPYIIHAEVMTHRVFSRNASSTRAIPVEKMLHMIETDPFVPLFWGKNQPGMQAGEEHNARVGIDCGAAATREEAWLRARDYAVEHARAFAKAGYHKQIVNRLLLPFMHMTVLISATEWDNFFELRIHKDCEPHMRMLADNIVAAMVDCRDDQQVQALEPGQWHLPFIDAASVGTPNIKDIMRSVAMCASTSYKTVDGFEMTDERAQKIWDQLLGRPVHASPFEHVACADHWLGAGRNWSSPGQHRNFTGGWRQYRAMIGA